MYCFSKIGIRVSFLWRPVPYCFKSRGYGGLHRLVRFLLLTKVQHFVTRKRNGLTGGFFADDQPDTVKVRKTMFLIPSPRGRRHHFWEESARPVDREIDRFFRQLYSEGYLPTEGSGYSRAYPIDMDEYEDKVVIEAEMPGFTKDEIEVTVENDVLTITAERKAAESDGKKHLNERRYTRVERSVALPATVDEEKISGNLKDGVLTLRLPKTEKQRPRRIQIE